MTKVRSRFAKLLYGFVWFIFLPNTIYILTDITHLFEDWTKVDNLFRVILLIQYGLFSIVGIVTFVVAIYFFQKLLQGKNKKRIQPALIAIFILNLIVGFGVVLGGIQRTNSWHIFTDPSRVLEDSLDLFYSQELLVLSLGVGLFANAVYFIMVKTVATWGKKFLKSGH